MSVASSVSIVRCGVYNRERIHELVTKAVDLLGGMSSFIKHGEKVLIKPNLLKAARPEAAVTTHPEVVRAVIRMVHQAGGIPSVGDSPGIGEEMDVLRRSGILTVIEEEGASVADFTDSIKLNSKGKFKHFEIARCVANADAIINLPKLKTHGMMIMTGAVKNLFGCIPGKKKVQWHFNAGIDQNSFARMLVELSELLKPRLSIVDAVAGMEGNGPGSGTPRSIGLILAGQDPVSVDVISGLIIGVSPHQNPVIRAAGESGIGECRVENINVLGQSIVSVKVKDFILPQSMHSEWPLPEWARRCLKDALTARPVIDPDICVRCGLCKSNCPRGSIIEAHGGLRIDYRNCIRCFCCQEFCPEGAITIGKGWMLKFAGG
jgi:uncharacterized protein (DUF362 family)/Pyruvate/2-oxoacid:ferredoxin oxidoreductase delta subunit